MYRFDIGYTVISRRAIVQGRTDIDRTYSRIDLFHLCAVRGGVASEMERLNLKEESDVIEVRDCYE